MSEHNPRALAEFLRSTGIADAVQLKRGSPLKHAKEGGVIESEVRVVNIPDEITEYTFWDLHNKVKHPIEDVEELIAEEYRDKNGHIRHMIKGQAPTGSTVRRIISREIFELLSQHNSVSGGEAGGDPASTIVGVTTGLIEKMIEYFEKGAAEIIKQRFVTEWMKQIGITEQDLPEGWEKMELAELKNIVRQNEHNKNNADAIEYMEKVHEGNVNNPRYVGTLEEVIDKIPNFRERLLLGEFELVNSGMDVFKVDPAKIKRKIKAAKAKLAALSGADKKEAKEEKEEKVEKKPIGEQYEVLAATEAPKEPAPVKRPPLASSSVDRYPAGSSDKVPVTQPGAVDMRPTFGKGLRMIRFR